MAHNAIHGGLQQHSIGEAYPYAVVIIDNAAGGFGYAVARNLITGETLQRHDYRGDIAGSFDRANNAAENDARRAATRDRDAAELSARRAAELPVAFAPELWECRFLLPAGDAATELTHWLLSAYGGFTRGPDVSGVWRDPQSGEVYSDETREIRIAVASPHQLRSDLAQWVSRLGQICLYFVGPHNDAHFIYPPASASVAVETDGRHNWWGQA